MMPARTQPTSPTSDALRNRRRRNALWISGLTAAVLTVVTAVLLINVQTLGSDIYAGVFLAGFLALTGLVSLLLSSRGQVGGGMGILITVMVMSILLMPYLLLGQVVAPVLALIVITTTIAIATLPTNYVVRTAAFSAVLGTLAILADLFLPVGFGIQTNTTISTPISAILAIVFTVLLLRNFSSFNLQAKILIAFTLVALVPLLLFGTAGSLAGRQAQESQAKLNLSDLAANAADKADAYITAQLDSLRTEAQQPTIIAYMTLPTFQRPGSPEEANALRTLNTFVRKDLLFIYSYALLDVSGRDILDTAENQIGRDESGFDYFKVPFNSGLPYVSTLVFESGNKANIHFSTPVRNLSGDVIGILRAEYNAAVFQNLMRSLLAGHEEQQQLVALVDARTYVRVAYSGPRNELYKSFSNYGPIDMANLQLQGLLPPGPADEAIASSDAVVAGIQKLEQTPYFTADLPSPGVSALTTGARMKSVKWVAIASQPESVLYAPVRIQNRAIVLGSIALILLAVLSSLYAARIISQPVLSLKSTAEKLAAGDLTAQAVVSADDEIGELAATFNRMSDQVKLTLQSLETRVAERTNDLDVARRQSEARAHDLEVISDVARIISGEQRLDSLLPLITNLITEKFGYYHTGIFLLDSNRQFAILQAASSEGGKRMLAHGHSLAVGQTGIVGYVAQTGQPRIALDVGADAVFFNNPDLPNTRSEIALPLNARGQTIGVLDMQSTDSGVFTVENLSTLTVLADQVAIAIDNARLFSQTEAALAEVQSVYRQYISQEWTGFVRRSQGLGYQQTLSGGARLKSEEFSAEARAALERGEVVLNPAHDGQTASLSMPVKLRGQVIGVINVQPSQQGHEWNVDEISLVQAVSDRMALALENARLFEESTRRAELERLSADLSGKIGSSIRLESILQITAQELSQALGGDTEVLVQVQPSPSATVDGVKPQPVRK